jgi:hypothetical protein
MYERFADKVNFGDGVSRDNVKGARVRVQIDFWRAKAGPRSAQPGQKEDDPWIEPATS